jgi:hypothetical protein
MGIIRSKEVRIARNRNCNGCGREFKAGTKLKVIKNASKELNMVLVWLLIHATV